MKNQRINRIYSAREKKALIRQLLSHRDSVAWHSLLGRQKLNGKVPSRRTLYRIFKDQTNSKIRDQTALQIENLLAAINKRDVEVESNPTQIRQVARELTKVSGTFPRENRAFLEYYQGCFKCVRLTTSSSEILVTHLRVFEESYGYPGFVHVEAIPDEATGLPSRSYRVLEHRGFVLVRDRRADFISVHPALRQMSCLISSNPQDPMISGLLLSEDAINRVPFAARILAVTTSPVADEAIVGHKDYGLFHLQDEKYAPFLPYIINEPPKNMALAPMSQI